MTSLKPGGLKMTILNIDSDTNPKAFVVLPWSWLFVLNKVRNSIRGVDYPAHEQGHVVLLVVDVEQEWSEEMSMHNIYELIARKENCTFFTHL